MAYYRKKTLKSGKIHWQAVVKQHGRIIAKKTFPTKTLAKTWATELETNHQRMAAYSAGGGTVTYGDLAREYMDSYEGKAASRIGDVKWSIDQLGDNTRLMEIDVIRLNRVLERFERTPVRIYMGVKDGQRVFKDTDRRPTPRAINSKRSSLVAVLKLGVSKGYITDNPANRVPRRSGEVKRDRYLSPEEERRLLEAARESTWPQMFLLVLMAIDTGARRGELISLQWQNVDLKARSALLVDTKNGTDRRIPLSAVVVEELLKHRQTYNPYVFPSNRLEGRHIDPRKPWENLLRDTGIEGLRFHDLRHSCASFLLSSGHSLDEIGRLLGHKSTQTTLRYAHLLEARGKELVDAHAARRAEI